MPGKAYDVQDAVRHQLLHPAQALLLWDGPSELTGEPVIVMATAYSTNRKIGRMLQLWVLLRDVSPIEAVKSGADSSVCGDCALRGNGDGTKRICYTEWWRAVSNVWQGRHRARRVDLAGFLEAARDLPLRLTAYGDPTALPLAFWDTILAEAPLWTGYTHQWRLAAFQGFRRHFMASVESPEDMRAAQAMGWRTFRVSDGSDLSVFQGLEVLCPHERNAAIHCDACNLCQGAAKTAKSIVITVHGNGAKWFLTPQ